MFSFQKILFILFSFIFAAIILLGVTSYKNSKIANYSASMIKHTQVVLDEADLVLSSAKDLQLESSGYVISGDSNYIGEFQKSKKETFLHAYHLKELTIDNTVQQPRIDSLIKYLDGLATFSEETITVKSNQEFDERSLIYKINQSKLYRNEITNLVEGIKNEENRLLAIRQRENATSISDFRTTFFAMLASIFLLMNIVFFVIKYYLKKQKSDKEKIRESEKQFRLLVNNVKDYAIFMTDPSGNIISWNNGAEKIKGFSAEEVIGKNLSIFYTDEERKKGYPLQELDDAGKNGSHETQGWRVRKDGSTFWANVITTAVYDEQGNIQAFTKVLHDDTERKKAEESTKRALEKEIKLSEMKSNFVSTASHEFRTPLSTILSSVALLKNYTSTAEQQDKINKHIERIRSSIKNLIAILDDFLLVEQIEKGKATEKTEELSIREFTGKLCEEMKVIAKPAQSIIYKHEGKEKAKLDPVFLRHILANLISNAIKYSPENAPIDIQTIRQNGTMQISVKDRGIGISAEDQMHLFERFFRGSNVDGIQGTGLGLNIVKHYVDLMKGSIKIQSEPGKGTEFIIEIRQPE